jgi:hypothetical protein
MQLLLTHQGPWRGLNRFRLRPTDEPFVAPATAQLDLGAGGNLTVIRYTWTHAESGPQEGLLVVGPAQTAGAAVGLWGDSWHQSPGATSLSGTVAGSVLSLGYTYGDGWEWHIVLDVSDPQVLRMRMDNVVPAAVAPGGEPLSYWAMDAELHRTAAAVPAPV